MPRKRYQRPAVKEFGRREKLWRIEYREYFLDAEGKERFRHKSKTWSRKDCPTKSEAQRLADKFMADLQGETVKHDGSMTVGQFWDRVYLPIRLRHWTGNTAPHNIGMWRNHIQPEFGSMALKDVMKSTVELALIKIADKGFGPGLVDNVRIRLHSIFEAALDDDLILKNPCRKVESPPSKKARGKTRSLTVDEVGALWGGTEGRDYLIWRLMILTGVRIGEVFPLQRSDITRDGLRIDEAVVNGKRKLPKWNKTRTAILSAKLRAEMTKWLDGHDSDLIFPSLRGCLLRRSAGTVQDIVRRGRAIIPDLTFRICRTTFATLFDGESIDRTSIMGHFDEAFTEDVYRRPIQKRMQKSVDDMDKRLKVVPISRKRRA